MDKINVELIEISGLKGAYRAVQKPYGKEVDNPSELLHKVSKILKHESVLEHIQFQFDVTGSSRLELQEHMRHRHASPTVQSTRYALKFFSEEIEEVSPFDFGSIESFVKKHTVFTPRMLSENTSVKSDEHEQHIWQRFSSLKFFANRLRSYKADEAKYELPESFRTSFVWTINLRSMLNFLELRTAKNAHFEIRHIANLMKDLICENDEIRRLVE